MDLVNKCNRLEYLILFEKLSTDPEEIINSLYEKEDDEQKIGKIDMDEDYVPEDVPK
jgi:hypothetical protein